MIIDTDLLIVGYGNTLRGDDGIGPMVVEEIGSRGLPGVRTLIHALLAPELADPVSRAREVIFVDASVEPKARVLWRPLEPGDTTQLLAHSADPRTLLALAREVFGHAPKAWWLTLPVYDLGFQVGLSSAATPHYFDAVNQILEYYQARRQTNPAAVI